MRNYIINSRFQRRAFGESGVCTNGNGTYIGAQGKMWAAPGIGGAFNWSFQNFPVGQIDVPGNPEKFLRLTWTVCPTSGETQYQPGFRWTFFECYIRDANELHGQTLNWDVHMRIGSGSVFVRPILWVNYANGDYTIFTQPGVSPAQTWLKASGTQAIPQFPSGKVLNGHYIGFGLDFVYQTAPTIDIAIPRVWCPALNTDVQIRPKALELMMADSAP